MSDLSADQNFAYSSCAVGMVCPLLECSLLGSGHIPTTNSTKPNEQLHEKLCKYWNSHAKHSFRLQVAAGRVMPSEQQKPWKRANPKPLSRRATLSKGQKAAAKKSAREAGRPYPNLVDNMRVAKKK
jgi:hypothetical protein